MAEPIQGRGGPLAGIRILEVGHFIAAPFAARLLADYGAEVIKIEPPGVGDPLRTLADGTGGQTLWWSSLGRNKKSVTIDLRQREGQALFLDLVRQSDAVIENFRVGQLERWNIGWERIKEANPEAVLVRISGFGQTGPYSDRVAFAPIGEAFGGLRYLIRDPASPEDRPPVRASLSLGDSIASLFGALGLLSALLGRQAGGGTCVDVSMYESVFALLESTVSDFGANGTIRAPAGSAVPNMAPSNTYRCADGTWACLTSTSDRLFLRLARAIGQEHLASDPRFRTNAARAANRLELDAIIAAWVLSKTYPALEAAMVEASIPVSKIFSIEDCVNDPHYRARGSIVAVEDPDHGSVLQPSVFPVFETGGDRPCVRWPGPRLGQHNDEVLRGVLGLGKETVEALCANNVV